KQREARAHPMLAPRESPEHGGGLGVVHGLAEHLAIDLDDRIGAQHPRRPTPALDVPRLGDRQSTHQVSRALVWQRSLVDRARVRHPCRAQPAEQFVAAWRGRGEDEHGRMVQARHRAVKVGAALSSREPHGTPQGGMWWFGCWVVGLVLVGSCATAPREPRPAHLAAATTAEPLAAALATDDYDATNRLLAEADRRYPAPPG